MTMGTKIVFIITLIVSIIVPFGYYLLGEKSRTTYLTISDSSNQLTRLE